MSERFQTVGTRVRQKSSPSTHCMIHSEALASRRVRFGQNIVLTRFVIVCDKLLKKIP